MIDYRPTTPIASTVDGFRDASATASRGTGQVFRLRDSNLSSTSIIGGVLSGSRQEMLRAREAFADALKALTTDADLHQSMKLLVDSHFDASFLSTAKVQAFFTKYPTNERILLAARCHGGESGQATPSTPRERLKTSLELAAIWKDESRLEPARRALADAVVTLEQFKGTGLRNLPEQAAELTAELAAAQSRVATAYERGHLLSQRLGGVDVPANLIGLSSDENNAIRELERATADLLKMPTRIGERICSIQQDLLKLQYEVSMDLAQSRWQMTSPRSAQILATAQQAGAVLGETAGLASTIFGVPPAGPALKATINATLTIGEKFAMWHASRVLPGGIDLRNDPDKEAAHPLQGHDRAARISSRDIEKAMNASVWLLKTFGGVDLENFSKVFDLAANSPFGTMLTQKWSELMARLATIRGEEGSGVKVRAVLDQFAEDLRTLSEMPLARVSPTGAGVVDAAIQGVDAVEDLENLPETARERAEETAGEAVESLKQKIAEKLARLINGERSDISYNYGDIVRDLDRANALATAADEEDGPDLPPGALDLQSLREPGPAPVPSLQPPASAENATSRSSP